MTKTITGLFDSYADAQRAVTKLHAAGVPEDDMSLIANNAAGAHAPSGEAVADHAAEDAEAGAGLGAAIGGVGGLLAGLGLLAIPGVGPVVAVGWLGATLLGAAGGAAVGAAAGGLVGALVEAGVPDEDAHVYAEGVRRGGTLVTARVEDSLADTARAVLNDGRSVSVDDRRRSYQEQGWSRFDPAAPPYTAEEVGAEPTRYDQGSYVRH